MAELEEKQMKRAFSAATKQNIVLDWLNTPSRSMRKTAAKYGLSSAGLVSKWSKDPNLFDQDTKSPVLLSVGDRKRMKFHPGKPLKHSELEVYLKETWEFLREDGRAVDINLLVEEAGKYYRQYGVENLDYYLLVGVVRRFMNRHGLRYREKTHTGMFIDEQEMADTVEDFVRGFTSFIRDIYAPVEAIYNMDQTAVFYDNAPSKTLEMRGKKCISINTGSSASLRATVFLCISFSGAKLRPMVVFKAQRGKTVHKKLLRGDRDGCDHGNDYTVQENAWCDQFSMNDWINSFVEQTGKGFKLLLLDNFSVHCTSETCNALSAANTQVEFLPPNYTSKLQPLDVGINKPFKDRLKRFYITDAAKLPRGQQLQVTRQMVSNWIAKAWSEVPVSAILNTVSGIGYVPRSQ